MTAAALTVLLLVQLPETPPAATPPPAAPPAPPAPDVIPPAPPPAPPPPPEPWSPSPELRAPPSPPPASLSPTPPAAVATEPAASRAPESPSWFQFGTLIQARNQQTWVSIEPALEARVRQEYPASADDTLRLIRDTARARDGLQLRWASLRFAVTPTRYLRAGMEIDFAQLLLPEGAARAIWEAPIMLSPARSVDIVAGVLHVPFSMLELIEPAEYELAEKGPAHELLEEQLSLARRNVGGRVDVRPLTDPRRLQLTAGAFQGATTAAVGAQDFRGPGLLAARVLAQPVEPLRLGASVAWRPRATLEWWDELRYRFVAYEPGLALAANAVLAGPRFVFRAEGMMGSRTDVDVPVPLQFRRGDARNFAAVWAMAVANLSIAGVLVRPALRVEWLDVDTRFGFESRSPLTPATGAIVHVSAGINVDLDDHTRLLLDFSHHDVEPGTRHGEFREILRYDADWTSLVLQLQIRV
jgi:hypothetical protein